MFTEAQDAKSPLAIESTTRSINHMPSPHTTLLAPSILAGDHANLRSSLKVIEDAGLQWVHLDIMDGHFVPNLSFGPQTIKALRPDSKLFFDVHLMLDNPHLYIDAFLDAGAEQITIHVEPDYPVAETLAYIKSQGCKCGVVLNPDTPAETAKEFLPVCDIVLLMTVQPGFGGQSFRHDVLPKIEQFDTWRSEMGLNYRLEIDGGVDLETAPLCSARGADALVAGTAFFKANDQAAFIASVTA
jgi:ribulose-phosphate 3-epimerase